MIRLSLSQDEFDTLKHDLELLQRFRHDAVAAPKLEEHYPKQIAKVSAESRRTEALLVAIDDQVTLQDEVTQVVRLPIP